ncbi:hypothetical protein CMI37_00870 [Candidatus Pacearchaeota archaeon]|nr:hypothetical protein [Candidatus Pacearchaeota archaeon]|tara:strand:- start:705 stop:1424 length:720 start_codon:yes stop_codon:yes gene_type:complete
MKVLVSTSKKYSFLLKPYYTLFNKYWPGQDVVFLGFDECEVPELPDNFSFVSLGKQADYGKIWSDPLIPYIQSLKDQYFVFTMEDVMLIDHVDPIKLKRLEDEIQNGASKAHLDRSLNNRSDVLKEGIRAVHPHASYRTSLSPAIWTKRYFMKYLKPDMTPWDFEMANMEKAKNDGNLIITLDDEKDLYYNSNVFLKGQPFPRAWCGTPYGTSSKEVPHMEDIEYLLKCLEENKEKYAT